MHGISHKTSPQKTELLGLTYFEKQKSMSNNDSFGKEEEKGIFALPYIIT